MKIKVILLDTIKGVGKKDQIVEVKDGYANNFLFPQKKAVLASAENLNKLKQKEEKTAKDNKKEIENAEKLRDELKDKMITLTVKAGENGKVFGSIGSKEILEAIEKQLNLKLNKKNLSGETRVKEIGIHNIELKLHKDIKAIIQLEIKGMQ